MNTYKKIRGLLAEAKQNIPRRGFVQQRRDDTRGEGQPKGAFSVQMAKDAMSVDAEKDKLKKQDRMRNFVSKFGSAMFKTKRKAHSQKMKDAGITEKKKTQFQKDEDRLKKDKRDLDIIHSKKKFEVADLVPQVLRPKPKLSGGRFSRSRETNQMTARGKVKTKGERLHGRKVRRAKRRLKDRDDAARSARLNREKPLPPLGTRVALDKIKQKRDIAIAQKKADRKVLKASTEINMNGYDRIYEMLLGESKMQSRDFPGHEKRMKGHMDRIQKDPRFKEPDQAAKDRGKKGAEISNKNQGK